MATFGHVTTGITQTGGLTADKKHALRVIAPESGTVTSLFADMQNSGTEIQSFRAGVYNDNPTISAATLISQSDVVLLAPGATRNWVGFSSGLNAAIVGGNVYWLVLHVGGTGGNASFWYDAGVGSKLFADDAFTDGLSATFGTTTSSSDSVAMYASYIPAAGTGSIRRGLRQVAVGSTGWK